MTDTAVQSGSDEHWALVGRRSELELALSSLLTPGSAGLAIHGPTGVGRSRFVAELLDELEPSDAPDVRRVVRIVATDSAGSIPLGALAHLLPGWLSGDASLDPVRVLTAALDALVGDTPLLLSIDDAHLLDAVSLTLLHQLVQESTVQLLVTVRSDEPEPDGLSALWRSDRIARIDLAPLPDESVDTLLHLGLAGPVDGRAAKLLREASGGSPLLLREVVRTALDEHTLHRVDGVWRLDGPLPVARRAVELVAGRLTALSEQARSLLELLVLVGQTPLALVDEVADSATLEQLESDGLIEVRAGAFPGDDHTVDIPRHVVNEAVRGGLSPLRTRNILRSHAERYEQSADGTSDDQLRIAEWRLSAGLPGDPLALEHAATLARHAEDFETTVRFAEAADRSGGTLRSGLLWGDALYELCRWEQCEQVLGATAARPGHPLDRLRLCSARASNLLFGLMRGDEALEMTRAALVAFDAGQPEWVDGLDDSTLVGVRLDLVSRVALLQMYGGDPAAALVTLGDPPPPVPPGDDEDPEVRDALRTRVLWAIPGVPAIALSGRTADAVDLGSGAFEEHTRLGGEVGFSSLGTHLVTLGHALQEHGDLARAREIATAGYETTLAGNALLGQIWFGLNLGRIGLLSGHPETARRWAREVLAATSASRWLGPRQMALNGMAAASAMLGDLPAAHLALEESESIGEGFGFLFPERALGRAWVAAADGRLGDARSELLTMADRAASTGHLTIESWLRHEAVRMGAGDSQTTRLTELADGSSSPLLAVRAAYAHALSSGDPDELSAVAETLESMEFDLAASELFGAAAEAVGDRGLPRAANAFALRASAAADRSEGARSHRLHRVGVIVPLTAREREVAGLAAAGVPSKEIAERLFLSVRTVNNHLQNAYTKLGVSSRAEVARVLEDGG